MREKPVKRKSLADQIVSALRKDVFTGVYEPGQNLPTERELAQEFGTSRGTLRRALQTLNQEGWIETVQGRGNTVCDFRQTVGVDVLPELFFSCPELIVTPEAMHILIDFNSWIYEQILLSAADKATPEDEPRLLELISVQTEDLTVTRFWDNEARYYGELLRIGGNVILRMTYNHKLKLTRRIIESGIAREFSYPIPIYQKINRLLIHAVCSGDRQQITELMKADRKHMIDSYRRMTSAIADYTSKQPLTARRHPKG